LVLALNPADLGRVFRNPAGGVFSSAEELAALQSSLGRVGTVLLDRGSWPQYATAAQRVPGSPAELNRQRVEIAGTCNVGTGVGYNGRIVTSEPTCAGVLGQPESAVPFGLVRLPPGTDAARVREALAEQLPPDVSVLTRQEANEHEVHFWMTATAVGQ